MVLGVRRFKSLSLGWSHSPGGLRLCSLHLHTSGGCRWLQPHPSTLCLCLHITFTICLYVWLQPSVSHRNMRDDLLCPSRSFRAMLPFQEPSFNPTPAKSTLYMATFTDCRNWDSIPLGPFIIQPTVVIFTTPKYVHTPCSRFCLYRTTLLTRRDHYWSGLRP